MAYFLLCRSQIKIFSQFRDEIAYHWSFYSLCRVAILVSNRALSTIRSLFFATWSFCIITHLQRCAIKREHAAEKSVQLRDSCESAEWVWSPVWEPLVCTKELAAFDDLRSYVDSRKIFHAYQNNLSEFSVHGHKLNAWVEMYNLNFLFISQIKGIDWYWRSDINTKRR